MSGTRRNLSTLAAALATATLAACASAYADKPARTAIVSSPSRAAPYQVDLIGEDGSVLPTYSHRGRFYILGEAGRRYSVRVTNPTATRVEAVVSVDGLDVVDGRAADFASKRGYVIAPYGQVVIDGFRTSMEDVATFRFSSVSDSYAGRKGMARNVGVIGVALFAERPRPEPVYLPQPDPYIDDEEDGDGWHHRDAPAEHSRPAPRGATGGGRGPAPSSADSAGEAAPSARSESAPCTTCDRRQTTRPGLGTEFGERRGSRVQWVDFQRAHPTRPTAMAELRYNDRDGLIALGVRFPQPVPPEEIEIRETADPFPGTGFATPPPR